MVLPETVAARTRHPNLQERIHDVSLVRLSDGLSAPSIHTTSFAVMKPEEKCE